MSIKIKEEWFFDRTLFPEYSLKTFQETINLEKGLTLSITHRLEIHQANQSTPAGREYLKPLFGCISFKEQLFIGNIMDAIRFQEMLGGFVSNLLDAEERRHIGEASFSIVAKEGKSYLRIGGERQVWEMVLDKYECRVVSTILSITI
jgi:hypothetical protein